MLRSLLWRSMFIEVHVLCSGLHSGGPCLLRSIFIEVHVLRIGLHFGGPHSLSYN